MPHSMDAAAQATAGWLCQVRGWQPALLHDLHACLHGLLVQVAVVDCSTGREYVFPCSQWFDAATGDGRIERRLQLGRWVVGSTADLLSCA